MIRHAHIADIPALAKIINDCAEYGQMLHRSLAYLYEHVRDFQVAVEDDKVVGVCGLSILWANLGEVYALAVAPAWRGRGLGRLLVLSVVDEAEELGIKRLMTLTYEDKFFGKLGFAVVDRQALPLKVWNQCIHCPKHQACDEIAMVRVMDVPDLDIHEPEPEFGDLEAVPVLLKVRGKQAENPSDGGR